MTSEGLVDDRDNAYISEDGCPKDEVLVSSQANSSHIANSAERCE
jgi:hypothetical protein